MRRIIAASIGLVLLVGCGSKQHATLSGTVKYKGQAVNGATLFFCTPGGNGSDGIPVITDQEGKFTTSSMPVGEYKIYVQGRAEDTGRPSLKGVPPEKQAEMKQKLDAMPGSGPATIEFPAKYKAFGTTDLKATVTGGKVSIDLVLND